tara:strand:- start:638 stop:1150 length:513 start_codon:yes stop_codon:yes gene_type:complete
MKAKIFKVENEELVLQEIAKLQPLNYNQFRWWRRYDQPNRPLHKNASFLDKIRNGDLDFSHYWWQAKLTEIEMNDLLKKSIDYQDFSEKSQVDRARRRRLWEDFEKDEAEKLQLIRKEFSKEFRMTEEDYENELFEFDGSLEDLYHHCSVKYGKKLRIKSKRGRPKKYGN